MKFYSACFILFFGLATMGKAQLIDNYFLHLSINETLAFSTDRATVREPLLGWEIGLSAEKEVVDNLYLSSGTHLSRIRFGMEDVGASYVTYLSFPLDLKGVLPLNFYALAGVQFDFKIGYQDARKPVEINGWPGWMGDGFASASDIFVPGWTVGIGKKFSLFGYNPWIEISYGEDFKSFSGYDGLISMNKRTRKVSIGIPLLN